MSYINNKRKSLALSLGIFIGIITIFINILGGAIFTLKDDIKALNKYEEGQTEKYLDYTIETQTRVANAIQSSWNNYSDRSLYMINKTDFLKNYIDLIVSTILDIHIRSSIIVIGDNNKILYNGYMNTSYYNICENITTSDITDDSLHVLNGDPYALFGSSNRLYVIRRELIDTTGKSMYVYVAFSEKIVYEGFFGSLDHSVISNIYETISTIMYILVIFLISCIGYGWFLIFYVRSFQEKLFNSKIYKSQKRM